MSFLFPAFWAAMALAGPIVIFYLVRERPRRSRMSTLLFWDSEKPKIHETPLWRKLRRWLSLLLQILFLALLVFALARPLADWESAAGRREVLIVDPSASMGAATGGADRLAAAVEAAREAVGRLRFFDEAAIILASDPPRVLSGWTRSRSQLGRALDGVGVEAAGTDPRPALRVAGSLVADREGAVVRVLSDGVWDREVPEDLTAGVVGAWGGAAPRNVGVTAFAARASLVGPGEFALLLRVEAAGTEAVSTEVEVTRDGNLIDAREITVEPGAAWEETWTLPDSEAGTFAVALTPEGGDALAVDNGASVTIAPQPTLDVTLVSEPDGFLEAAFASIPNVRVNRVWPVEAAGSGDAAKLFVFAGAVPPPDFAARATVLLTPTESGRWGGYRGEVVDPLVSEADLENEILRFTAIDRVRAGRAVEFDPAAGATTLASTVDGPLVFGRWRGADRWLVIGFDLAESDFVLRTSFPILMANVVQSLRVGSPDGERAAVAGGVETRLVAVPPIGDAAEVGGGWGAWAGRPLWWWAVLLGLVWVVGEWWTYQRRVTE